MENQFQALSAMVKDRIFICKDDLTPEMIVRLRQACLSRNIPFEDIPNEHGKRSLTFTIFDPSIPCETEGVKVEFVCPLVPWYRFFPITWNEFIELAEGTRNLSTQDEYAERLKEYDEPRIQVDMEKNRMRMDYLFNLGPEHHINAGIFA